MSIRKRYKKNKKVFYEVQVYSRGLRLAYKCFESKAEAHSWHDQQKEKLEMSPNAINRKHKKRTFLDVLEIYKKEKFSKFTFATQQSHGGKFVYLYGSPLAQVKILDLSPEHIDLWLDWLRKHPKVDYNKRKSFVQELKLLGNILHWYHHFVDPSFIVPITRRHKEKCFFKKLPVRRPDYYIKPEDVKKWIYWMKSKETVNPIYWKLATFMVLTGVRVGEACGLKWSALDLEKGVAHIFRRVSWDRSSKKAYIEETAKTKQSVRSLVLSKDLVYLLKQIKKESADKEFVFSIKGNLLSYGMIRDVFTRGFKALNLPWSGTHICRHTYATMALYATKDLSSVQANLGHTTQQTTEKYAKVVKMISSDTAEKTAQLFQLFPRLESENHRQITDEGAI